MKRVFIDFERIKNPYCGLGRYSIALGRELALLRPEHLDLTYFLPTDAKAYFPDSINVTPVHVWKKHLFNPFGLTLPSNIDLWHLVNQDTDYFPFSKQGVKLLTIHDLNFLHVGRQVRIENRLQRLKRKIESSHHLTTISNYVRDEIIDVFGIPSKRISVIYNGVEISQETPQKPEFSVDNFLFTISQVVEKKNVHTLVDMMQHLPDKKLIIAGQKDGAYASLVEQRIQRGGLQDRIKLTGPVSEAEKLWLYQHCDAFVFPSLAEGFGLPPIEAMRFGKPVILSRATSLPEIGGEHASYWHDFEPTHMADTVRQAIAAFNQGDRREREIRHALSYNWASSASEDLNLYLKLLKAAESATIRTQLRSTSQA